MAANSGIVEIKVKGKLGNEPLSPENFDIREIKNLFDVVENLLYTGNKSSRPRITYSIGEGSVVNKFETTMQGVATFLAIIDMVNVNGNLDGLEYSAAKALSDVQQSAVRYDFTYEFGSPKKDSPSLTISKETSFHINESLWADAEFYFYGLLVNAGGKDYPNIHLQTKDYGVLKIATNKEILKSQSQNVLYKYFSVRASGKQNISNGELDPSSLELIEFQEYDPEYNAKYLDDLIKRATPRFKGIGDADEWVNKIRGLNV